MSKKIPAHGGKQTPDVQPVA